jgi:hypothetical protein
MMMLCGSWRQHDSPIYDHALANMNEATERGLEKGNFQNSFGIVYVFDTDVESVGCGWLKHSLNSLIIQTRVFCCYAALSSKNRMSISTELL